MAKLHFAALLAAAAVATVQVQASPPAVPIEPSTDSAEQRQALRKLSSCLAERRPRWARQTLAHPYLSDAQATAAAQALVGRDNCIVDPEVEMTFRTSGLVGSLAEHFLRAEMKRTDFNNLVEALTTLSPLNVSEDFALCVAARNPAAARDLALSEPGSSAESDAAAKLAAHVGPCTIKGEKLTVELQSLRALVSTALYRGITTTLAARD